MSATKRIRFAFILLFTVSTVYPQQSGLPFIRNYQPQEYKTSPQNWSVVQDQHGLMYFGNNDGVLEFDGVSWKLIKLPGVGPIAVDSTGRIFVGLDNDFGYLQPDSNGNYQYYSLKSKLPENQREINICYRVYVTGDGVIFQTADKILIYNNERIKVITSSEGFPWSFVVNNRFYIPESGRGMFYLQNDNLSLLSGGEQFENEYVISMIPYQKNEILVVTLYHGVLIYSPGNPTKLFKPSGFNEVDSFLLENEAYCGTKLADGDFAIGTITGGIIVFGPNGIIKNVYNKSTGLQDNSVYGLYTDKNQQLWAALDNGISLIHSNLPFTQYTDKNGLNGATMCLRFFNNRFYVGTGQYLFIQNEKGDFQPVEGTESQNFHLFDAKGVLLLANLSGISEIKDKQAILLKNTEGIGALALCSVINQPEYLFAGATNGIYLLEYDGQTWKLKQKVKGFTKPAYKLDVDKEGNVWVSTFLDLYKLNMNTGLDSVISSQQCTPEQGLPSNYAMTFMLNSGEIVFCSEKGVYQYLDNKNIFEQHPDFKILTGKVIQFLQAENGNIWYEQLHENGNYEKGYLKLVDGKYSVVKTPFDKFDDIGSGDCPYNICPAPDGTFFLGIGSGLLQYNPSIEVNYNKPFNTLIRRVYSSDSLLFGGEELNYPYAGKTDGIEISYSQNNMIFHFAATFYEDAEKNLYSYRLIGSDSGWSEWTSDHKKEYTNLPEGRYIFQVKSRNQYQVTGSIASYSFSVSSPWYKTWWAIVLYFLIFILFLIIITKLYTRRLERQKVQLEKIVASRTDQVLSQKKEILEKNEVLVQTNLKLSETNKELSQTNEKIRTTLDIVSSQKEQIEIAHKQITDQNIELQKYRNHLEQLVDERTKELVEAKDKAEESDRLKTAFLQNMSHEIRTPMNGILGFLTLLKEPNLDVEDKNNYIDIIDKSGQRLLNTINDIIEISRIESNQVTVNYSEVDIVEIMDFHYNFFRRQAEEKSISLTLSCQIKKKQAVVETDKNILDNILTNLINNAIKFTEKGIVEIGNYIVTDSMVFYVKDTGIGIPDDRRDAIFDRFVQGDIQNTRRHEGSGLGLSIIKGYLEILDGNIWIESEYGNGSTFFFEIPYRPVMKKSAAVADLKEIKHISKKELTILVAEDDENSFLYINSILKNLTDNIIRATNGSDTVRLFKERPAVSLILMDIKMPEMNGLDATRIIREFNTTVPIIAQTAYALAGDRELAIEAGCNDYISKPLDSQKLIQLILKYT